MIAALFFIGFTYLWAGELFTHFLYPEPGAADAFFVAAALNPTVFDLLVLVSTVLIVLWVDLRVYRCETEKKFFNTESGVKPFSKELYLFLINRLYVDLIYMRWGNAHLSMGSKNRKSVLSAVLG